MMGTESVYCVCMGGKMLTLVYLVSILVLTWDESGERKGEESRVKKGVETNGLERFLIRSSLFGSEEKPPSATSARQRAKRRNRHERWNETKTGVGSGEDVMVLDGKVYWALNTWILVRCLTGAEDFQSIHGIFKKRHARHRPLVFDVVCSAVASSRKVGMVVGCWLVPDRKCRINLATCPIVVATHFSARIEAARFRDADIGEDIEIPAVPDASGGNEDKFDPSPANQWSRGSWWPVGMVLLSVFLWIEHLGTCWRWTFRARWRWHISFGSLSSRGQEEGVYAMVHQRNWWGSACIGRIFRRRGGTFALGIIRTQSLSPW